MRIDIAVFSENARVAERTHVRASRRIQNRQQHYLAPVTLLGIALPSGTSQELPRAHSGGSMGILGRIFWNFRVEHHPTGGAQTCPLGFHACDDSIDVGDFRTAEPKDIGGAGCALALRNGKSVSLRRIHNQGDHDPHHYETEPAWVGEEMA